MYLIVASILLLLLLVAIQDIRSRQIHIILPVALFIVSVVVYVQKGETWAELLKGIAFFTITFIGLTVYLIVKERRFVNPFVSHFGLGDFLFFISVCPLFYLYNFILYFIFSLGFSLVIYLIFKKFMTVTTIPLAGYAALFLILVIIKDLVFDFKKLTIL